MKKNAVLLLAALMLCCAACSQQQPAPQSDPPALSVPESTPDEQPSSEIASSPSEAVSEPEQAPLEIQSTQVAEFFLPGISAQGTKVDIDIPEDWTVDADKLVFDGQVIARFLMVEKYDDAAAYLNGLDTEFADAETVRVLDIPGLNGKCYHRQAENADEELNYYVCIDNRAVYITFTPTHGISIEKFETCLATIEVDK